jgi:hypothetical protein
MISDNTKNSDNTSDNTKIVIIYNPIISHRVITPKIVIILSDNTKIVIILSDNTKNSDNIIIQLYRIE